MRTDKRFGLGAPRRRGSSHGCRIWLRPQPREAQAMCPTCSLLSPPPPSSPSTCTSPMHHHHVPLIYSLNLRHLPPPPRLTLASTAAPVLKWTKEIEFDQIPVLGAWKKGFRWERKEVVGWSRWCRRWFWVVCLFLLFMGNSIIVCVRQGVDGF